MNKRNILGQRHERWLQRQSRERNKAEKKRLKDAKAAWKSLGEEKDGEKKQMRILSELVETRGKELRQAYENVVGIAHGYRTQKGRFKEIPSVTFFVSTKHPHNSKKLTEKNRIPDFLFTYCNVLNEYRLCAIPTDVEGMSVYKAVKPHSGNNYSNYIHVKPSDSARAVAGTLTCAVRIADSKGALNPKLYVMSCLHVLGMVQLFYPNFASNPEIFLPDKKVKPIGWLSNHFGTIRDKHLYSFDVALAEVDDDAKGDLKTVMPKPRPSCVIYHEDTLEDFKNCYIWTSSNGKIKAKWGRPIRGTEFAFPYTDFIKNKGLTIWHEILVEYEAVAKPGDSGSPVVSEDGDTLLGMYIGGGGGRAFMIPSNLLFKGKNYSGLTDYKLELTDEY